MLKLGRHLLLDILLEPPQEERAQDSVQAMDQRLVDLLRAWSPNSAPTHRRAHQGARSINDADVRPFGLWLLHRTFDHVVDGPREPLLKVLVRLEDSGHQKVLWGAKKARKRGRRTV